MGKGAPKEPVEAVAFSLRPLAELQQDFQRRRPCEADQRRWKPCGPDENVDHPSRSTAYFKLASVTSEGKTTTTVAELEMQFRLRQEREDQHLSKHVSQNPREVNACNLTTLEDLENGFRRQQQELVPKIEHAAWPSMSEQAHVMKKPPVPPGRVWAAALPAPVGSAPYAADITLRSATEEAKSAASRGLVTGTVKKLVEEKGFGFVRPDGVWNGTCDVFLHFSDLAGRISTAEVIVGTRLRFRLEIVDARTGKGRARDVTLLDSEAEDELCHNPETDAAVLHGTQTYHREFLLAARLTLARAAVRSRGRNGNRSGVSAGLGITSIFVPMPPAPPRLGRSYEDPRLDDEELVAELEARLDRELGADAKNFETFGDEGDDWCAQGWTFEEALFANSRLAAQSKAQDNGMPPSDLLAIAACRVSTQVTVSKDIEMCTAAFAASTPTTAASPRSRASSGRATSCYFEDKRNTVDELEEDKIWPVVPVCFQ